MSLEASCLCHPKAALVQKFKQLLLGIHGIIPDYFKYFCMTLGFHTASPFGSPSVDKFAVQHLIKGSLLNYNQTGEYIRPFNLQGIVGFNAYTLFPVDSQKYLMIIRVFSSQVSGILTEMQERACRE